MIFEIKIVKNSMKYELHIVLLKYTPILLIRSIPLPVTILNKFNRILHL